MGDSRAPRPIRPHDPIPAEWLQRVADAVIQRVSVNRGTLQRMGTSLCLNVEPGSVGGASSEQTFVVKRVRKNYLVCRKLGDQGEGPLDIYVAKPFTLREIFSLDGATFSDYDSEGNQRKATRDGVTEIEYMLPEWRVGDLVTGRKVSYSGVTVDGAKVEWICRSDSRYWAADREGASP